jgi:ATP/maltotriose-dependent transcriptional regulator MalT
MNTQPVSPAPPVHVPSVSRFLEEGQLALAQGSWEQARDAFAAALAIEEHPAALEGLGEAAWWLEDVATVFAARERAYRLYRGRNNDRSAGQMASEIAYDYAVFRLEMAISNGWLQRAHRLLDPLPPGPEQIELALHEAELCYHLDGDMDRVLSISRQARDLAFRLGEFDLEMLAMAGEGLALVGLGSVAEGMQHLDEAAVTAVSGEMRNFQAVTSTLCMMVWACEQVRDVDRASQWCDQFMRYCERYGLRAHMAFCRSHFASILAARGRWKEAEHELMHARDGLRERHALCLTVQDRLGELRRRQGRLDEADHHFSQTLQDPHSLLGKARVALDRGNTELARDLAESVLRRLSEHNEAGRIDPLALLVQIHCARGSRDEAEALLPELQVIASNFGADCIHALVDHARGQVALLAGDAAGARARFEDALSLYDRNRLPYEVAQVRLDLGQALVSLERGDLAAEQARLAGDALRSLGATAEAANDLIAQLLAPRQASVLSPREEEVLRLVSRGLSNQQIADELCLSKHTVRRHVSNILAKLDVPSRTAAVAYGGAHQTA